MNIWIGAISLIVTFFSVVLAEKFFKKEGLFVWISISTIIANILVCKNIDLFGFTTAIGNILFASNFLATDILCEKYTKEDGKKAIIMAACSVVVFIITMQIALLYIPSSDDISHESMKTLFSLNLRVSIASLVMFVVSNMMDIYIYNKIKEKVEGKMWLRNNVATIVCNSLENYLFSFFAFVGIYGIGIVFQIATVASVIEIIIAICDTPFLYLAKSKWGRSFLNA